MADCVLVAPKRSERLRAKWLAKSWSPSRLAPTDRKYQRCVCSATQCAFVCVHLFVCCFLLLSRAQSCRSTALCLATDSLVNQTHDVTGRRRGPNICPRPHRYMRARICRAGRNAHKMGTGRDQQWGQRARLERRRHKIKSSTYVPHTRGSKDLKSNRRRAETRMQGGSQQNYTLRFYIGIYDIVGLGDTAMTLNFL